MRTPCDNCPIRKGCDIFSEMCRLTPKEIVQLRPDLIRPLTRHQRYYYANKPRYRVWNAAAGRRYRKNNRARRLETERNWRAKHADTIAVTQRNWWDRNKDRINAERRERRAKLGEVING